MLLQHKISAKTWLHKQRQGFEPARRQRGEPVLCGHEQTFYLLLYRLESNVRSASVVGMVGAGGIGVVLWEIIRGFQYAETCAVMAIIVVTVTAIDLISARIRNFLV